MKKTIFLLILSTTTVQADLYRGGYDAIQLMQMEQQTMEMQRMNQLLEEQRDAARQAQWNAESERRRKEAQTAPSPNYYDPGSPKSNNQNCESNSDQVQKLHELLNHALNEAAQAKQELKHLKNSIQEARHIGARTNETGMIYFTDDDVCLPTEPCAKKSKGVGRR